ncbi:MAG: hypothetical protein HY904_13840 [Deltaproteobacteria bacterium]|nr:hypothetical protein [Deltaproteobacteria bacterium]
MHDRKRLVPWFVMLLVTGCGARSTPPRPSAGVLADAELGLRVAARVARVAWPDWVPGKVPFVVVGRHEQWQFRADAPPPGYAPHAFPSSLGPMFRAPSLTRPDGTRESFLSPRFFASADRINGSITFTIVEPGLAPFPRVVWAAIFTHEYFHAFQMQDPRWEEDLLAATQAARRSLMDAYNSGALRSSVDAERARVKALLQRLADGHALEVADVEPLVALRAARLHGARDAERALERMEGTARLVEETLDDHAGILADLIPHWQPEPAAARMDRWLGVTDGEFYYATGHGLARLLEATGCPWREQLRGRDLGELLLECVRRR